MKGCRTEWVMQEGMLSYFEKSGPEFPIVS